ncbi:uncharacterized protein (TIGR03089 family) [Spinactinospora alkalitolerans]|uniref:Uncharacterized protein (TIGR03089 family) n=1 Tax=Spinactinospora alkalitolerans TaxID=687207 RepID=A0A852U2M5_9ACTN|nr:TIGR03089 family protein [Spinactinospora alkalitolerans]NYE49682.1 uncharacterized protein (TIGR03089 family) [Spinactinospora alkalitolerans]
MDLWRRAVAVDPARPFVTAYDEATGGRVELSHATFDNWVAKTANLLVDGLGAEPGERVALALPVHWQSLVWLTACFSTGTTAVVAADGEQGGGVPEGDIVVADAARLDAALDAPGAREVVGASLHPLGAPLQDCPPAAMDYAVEVRGFGDRFAPAAPVRPAAVALDSGSGHRYTGSDLVAAAREKATEWKLTSADRVAIIASTSDPLTALGHDLSRFLAAVHSASALVLTSGADSTNLQARIDMERVTAIADARPEPPPISGTIKPLT